ncbi:hypothetical protein F66182_2969 [Fusarium sp. NRRL 66182]|nr:hypothetical protein F66182_2969 [Fusarium sp. NRRL 66182]
MLPLEPQGRVADRPFEDELDEHGQFPIDYRSRLTGPSSPASSGSSIRASTARRRAALTNKSVNNHLSETTPLRLSPAALKTPSAPQPSSRSALVAPLSLAPPSAAHHLPSSSVRTRDPGLHVEPTSPKLQSPLRHSVTFSSNENKFDVESQLHNPPIGPSRPLSVDMSFTGDKRPAVARSRASLPAVAEEPARNRLPTWFSRPNVPSSPSTAAPEPQPRRASCSSTKSSTPTGLSRFNFFGALSPTAASPSEAQNEALMELDIEKGLFPNGVPAEGTAFSPSAFKNLQMNATGLLSKFQAAYEQRTAEYKHLLAERDAQVFTRSEAEVKVEQLAKQVEDQASQMAERDAMIEYLLNQLAREKGRAYEEANSEKENVTSGASIMSEDLGIDEDRLKRWRKSTSTSSDDESVDEISVFSRSRSPTMSEISPVIVPVAIQPKPVTLEPPRAARGSNPQMNTFQKLIRGISSEKPKPASPATCTNCQGQTASMAWDTVNLLKDENKGLKDRVEELETAVEGALDVANGLGL